MIARENPTSGNTMNDYRPQRHMPFRGQQVLYRWITLFQLTALVLSYNFSGCNHHQIKKDYKFVIFASLNKINTTGLDGISSCSNTVTCLTVIDRTSPKVKNCSSEELMNQILSTLSKHCPDYSGWQTQPDNQNIQSRRKRSKRIRNDKDKKNESCFQILANLKKTWQHYSRIQPK
ncbi:thymic stromal lymphopoietin [Tachyglossus aculeatus]|uniref:thymic stromal lymphopoietin n=1 Tax=Tachyglossus aculeatus TaxID=9261 RepID=UPI0018F624A7|nr:thymic stromal lymphopoietin [Tachyglossus aculeatus]